VLGAVQTESARLAGVLAGLSEADFDRPTRCPPWSVRELLAHLLVACNRLPSMLREPQPTEAETSAAGYYRADRRFGPEANTARISAAADDAAAFAGGNDLGLAVGGACTEMLALARAEPPTRLVYTRWGDAMSLSDFLVTRVAELGVHGLDLADGLGLDPWLTPPAAEVIEWLLVRDSPVSAVPGLGWDRLTLIEVATGRRPTTDSESALLAGHGVRWLTFG